MYVPHIIQDLYTHNILCSGHVAAHFALYFGHLPIIPAAGPLSSVGRCLWLYAWFG